MMNNILILIIKKFNNRQRVSVLNTDKSAHMITTVSRTTAQVVGNSEVNGNFTFNTIVNNDFGCSSFDTSINTSMFQFPANGINITYNGTYLITATVSFPQSYAGGVRYLSIIAPNTITGDSDIGQYTNIRNIVRSQVSIATTSYAHSLSATVAWRLYTNTVIQMRVWQTGAAGSVSTAIENATNGTVNASLSAALILQ
jgi:hypothetical protein